MVKRGRAGVTLIELLIAITLVSLLSMGMLFAIRIGMNALERTNTQLMANRRVLGAQRALDQQIAGMIPMKAMCGGSPIEKPKESRLVFFLGEPAALRFISSYSLEEAGRGYPRILEYAVIPGRDSRGVRLIVNESLYTGPYSLAALCPAAAPGRDSLYLRPVEPNPRSFVLADRLAYCRLSYLGAEPKTGNAFWMPVYSGSTPPLAIRLEMAPLEAGRSLLQMTTMTVPVRVSRLAYGVYRDIDVIQQ